jgi:3-methyl-2-oxobutanoate hydroxymethyltransferase
MPQIRAIADGGMLVMGHIGLTPQSSGQQGGFKAQGRTAEAAKEVVEDAMAIQAAGAFALLVEAVPPEVCGIIREKLSIPVYSIGAGWEADGQLMICSDVLGIFQAFTPKFVKKYENLGEKTVSRIQAICSGSPQRAVSQGRTRIQNGGGRVVEAKKPVGRLIGCRKMVI